MLSSEFSKKLINYPHLQNKLQGIYSSDNLPKRIKKGYFIICNTDTSKGIGKHWYCVVKLSSYVLECFDSLGINEEKKIFLRHNFHQNYISKIKFNLTQVQTSDSNTCGFYVLYFIVNRFYNQDLSFSDLLNEIFVSSNTKNEELVCKFAKEHFYYE